jgi:predicted RNA-binding Zn-ribbon protein involved in translation (DUF1610 family)
MERFQDTGDTVQSFQDKVLVRCPQCDSFAIVRCLNPENVSRFAPRRFSCKACGSYKDWAESGISRTWKNEPPVDDYFHYPLWLQAPCCGQTLWAYNLEHLDFIEAFVSAGLRESQCDENYHWSNRSLFSRLPRWIQSAKNRESILKVIKKIRKSV